MTPLESWVHSPAAEALGWTLFHFLWEGVLVALVLAAALWVSRSARVRYAAACLALVAMLAGFGFTFGRLLAQQEARITILGPRLLPDAPRDTSPDSGARPSPRLNASSLLAWFAPLWMAGVLLFQVRAAAGWMGARRLRRTGVCCAHDGWQGRLNALAARLRVTRPVKLLESCLTDVPVAIGYLRPVILMPLGLVAGLPAGQVEFILIHELAHIRRHDYVANLLQAFAESLLFYHPAVWWISGVVRAERENCCDDWVLKMNGDAHEYAVALASLERNRHAVSEAALAATGGSLVKRIRRLLYRSERPRVVLAPVLTAGILALTAAVALAAWQAKPAASPSPAAAATPAPQPQATTLAAQERRKQAGALQRELESPYRKWVNEDVVYIITDEERAAFERLQTDAEREHFIEQFWQRRDPTPGTPANEFKEEHYRRIAYANEHYASSIPGWKTDRGRIYIIYGPPDEIESHPSGGAYQRPAAEGGGTGYTHPFEQWRYRLMPGVGEDVIVDFVDRSATGDYRMTWDPNDKFDAGRLMVPKVIPRGGAPAASGQPGNSRFFSTESGAFVTVEVTPESRMVASIPLDFDAQKYNVAVNIRAANGLPVTSFKQSVERPGPSPRAPFVVQRTLHPGSYILSVTVSDAGGGTQKTYTVDFIVK